MMNTQDELRHIIEGSRPDETVYGIGIVRFLVVSTSSATEALAKAKQIITMCLKLSTHAFDNLQVLKNSLPPFFVQKFRDESSNEDDEAYLKEWRAASDQRRIELEQNQQWTLLAWARWIKPENRTWWWWDAVVISDEQTAVAVA